ncbi:MAG: Gfo/Idh/MocA family oxidoreductase [Chloroflexi bacterium]|nr:Gfo/Idh/MocA family oxidoreductase [Chloroflexota bacterium]
MSNTRRTLRIGVIGAGRMGKSQTDLLWEMDGVAVTAACDLLPERAQAMAAAWGGRAYTDYEQMLATEELDGVYVCTPTHLHGDPALAVVEAGVPLFLEKPVELDLAKAGRLLRASESRGVPVCVALHWRYTKGHEAAAWLMEDKPVAMVNLRWYWTRPPVRWMWEREKAGGQIVDQNIHLIDLAQSLVGEIESVFAFYNCQQTNFDEGFDNWDGYAVNFRHKSGAVGLCAGTYSLFPEIQVGPSADFALRDELIRVTNQGAARFSKEGVEEWQNEGPFRLGVNAAFIEAIRTGNPSAIRSDLAAGIRSTAAALAANHSAQTGEVVNLDDFIRERAGL